MENKKTFSIKSNRHAVITIEGDDLTFNDGYHDLESLYSHRCKLFINYLSLIDKIKKRLKLTEAQDRQLFIWKSICYNENKERNGWFILGIGLDKGQQITYHLPNKDLPHCQLAVNLEDSNIALCSHYKYDGHTSEDVLIRLQNLMEDLNYVLAERFKNE